MATLPLAISVSAHGVLKSISGLNSLARATRSVGAGTIAIGTAGGIAVARIARIGAAFAQASISAGADMARRAREGEKISSKFSDAGLSAAEKMDAKWADVKESMVAAFVNALPSIILWAEKTIAWARYVFSVVKTWSVAATKAIGASFAALWEQAKRIGSRLGSVASEWMRGNFVGAAALLAEEISKSADLAGDAFDKIWTDYDSWSERTTGDFLLLQDQLAAAQAEYDKTTSTILRGSGAAVGKIADNLIGATLEVANAAKETSAGQRSTRELPSLLIRGTADEFIDRASRGAVKAVDLARQQLAEAKKQTAALLSLSDDRVREVVIA